MDNPNNYPRHDLFSTVLVGNGQVWELRGFSYAIGNTWVPGTRQYDEKMVRGSWATRYATNMSISNHTLTTDLEMWGFGIRVPFTAGSEYLGDPTSARKRVSSDDIAELMAKMTVAFHMGGEHPVVTMRPNETFLDKRIVEVGGSDLDGESILWPSETRKLDLSPVTSPPGVYIDGKLDETSKKMDETVARRTIVGVERAVQFPKPLKIGRFHKFWSLVCFPEGPPRFTSPDVMIPVVTWMSPVFATKEE